MRADDGELPEIVDEGDGADFLINERFRHVSEIGEHCGRILLRIQANGIIAGAGGIGVVAGKVGIVFRTDVRAEFRGALSDGEAVHDRFGVHAVHDAGDEAEELADTAIMIDGPGVDELGIRHAGLFHGEPVLGAHGEEIEAEEVVEIVVEALGMHGITGFGERLGAGGRLGRAEIEDTHLTAAEERGGEAVRECAAEVWTPHAIDGDVLGEDGHAGLHGLGDTPVAISMDEGSEGHEGRQGAQCE